MTLSYSKIIIMIIITYQTSTRNPFDGPAATNIGTFYKTWPASAELYRVLWGLAIAKHDNLTLPNDMSFWWLLFKLFKF